MAVPTLRLGINIDHIATLRNARKRHFLAHPDLLAGAQAAIAGGADNITFHLREDRRHILDEDVQRLRENLALPLNFEMAATPEMTAIALATRPHAVCLVPEKRQEVTTEGGLDVVQEMRGFLPEAIAAIQAAGIQVALFIDPDPKQVTATAMAGARALEFHTGRYCEATGTERAEELQRLQHAAAQATALGLEVHAGHGLDYDNVGAVAAIPQIVELNIGHHLVGDALLCGLTTAVSRMKAIILKNRSP